MSEDMNQNDQHGEQGAPDLESMSTDQLEQHLDKQESAPADESAPENQQGQGEQDGDPGKALDPMATIQKRLDEMHREMGRFRGLQSNLDKIDQRVEERVARVLQERERQAYLNSLSPEERDASIDAQRREQAYRDMMRREAVSALQEQFPGQLQFLERQMEAAKDQELLGNASRMAEGIAPGSSQGIASLFEQNYRDLNSQDPLTVQKALEWNERATNSPEFLVLELVKAQSQAARQGAQNFTANKAQEARAMGQGVRRGTQNAVARKGAADYSEAELNAMSIEELEKLVPRG